MSGVMLKDEAGEIAGSLDQPATRNFLTGGASTSS
jgi:hypothetical protein